MTRLTDEVVIAILGTPYVLILIVLLWVELLRERIRKLEKRAEKKETQWRIK